MNKKTNIILAMLLAVVGVFSLTSCKDDEPAVAKAVLCSIFSHDFDAAGGEIEVKVVSDALWHVEAPEWITVSPTTGSGTTFVTISAASNYTGTEMNGPRNGKVVFKGNTKASEAEVVVKQKGDSFKGAAEIDGTAFYGTKEGDIVIVKNMTVAAVYNGGFVATDGTANVHGVTNEAPALGTTVKMFGVAKTDKYGVPYVEVEKTVVGGTTASLPAIVDITADIDNCKAEAMTYVSLTGLYDAATNAISVAEKKNRGFAVAYANGVDMSKMTSHSVTVEAFYIATAAPAVNLIITGYVDNGVAENVFFQEDFEWLEPWSSITPAGQTVETNNPSATAQQLGTNKVDGVSTYDALLAKGYVFPFCCKPGGTPRKPEAQSYLQRNYLKFGLTDFYTGLTLPKIADMPDGVESVISFDWCSQRQGSGTWDDTQLVIIVKNGSDEQEFLVPTHSYEKDEVYAWLPVRIDLGKSVTKDSEITIRNIDAQWPAESGAFRWFIDNIKIVEK